MKEIIITVLGVLLVLLIGVGIYFAFFNGANDMGQNAVSQQGKLQQMTSDTDTVAGNMVKYYADQAEMDTVADTMIDAGFDGSGDVDSELSAYEFGKLHIGVRVEKTDGKAYLASVSEIQSQIKDSGVYKMKKYYDSNSELYVVLFDQTNLAN